MMHRFLLIIKLPNARDPISSTGTFQLKRGRKRLVLPIKPSVPLLCRSIYDFRFTIGGFHAISGDTDNNGEMNKCCWTNKAS